MLLSALDVSACRHCTHPVLITFSTQTQRFNVDAAGCSVSCTAVRLVLGDGLPTAIDLGAIPGAVIPSWRLQHPAVLPTVVEMLTSNMSSDVARCNKLVAEAIDVIGELVSTEANCASACDAGLLSTVLEVFGDALVDTSDPLHERAVWLTKTLGARKMSGREVRQYFSLMNVQGSIAGVLKPLQHMLDFTESRPAHYTHFAITKSHDPARDLCRAAKQFNFDSAAWPPAGGFTVSFWFKYAASDLTDAGQSAGGDTPTTNETVTLCSLRSVGDSREGAGVAVILDLRTNVLTLELATTPQKGSTATTTYTRCEFASHQFNPGQWHHITLSCERKKKAGLLFGKSESEIKLYANGICRETQLTPSFGNAHSARLQCILGGTYGNVSVQWDLGNLYVLRCCVTSAEAFVLHALGPNAKGFRYDYSHTILTSCLSSRIIQDLHRTFKADKAESVFKLVSSDTSIAHLSKVLLCYFQPSDGGLFCESTGDESTGSEAPASTAFSNTPAHARESRDSVEFQGTPAFVNQHSRAANGALLARVVSTRTHGAEQRDRRGLREAMFELGGMQILLYRLATLCPMESEQVAFLQLIFSLLRGSPENARSLHAQEG